MTTKLIAVLALCMLIAACEPAATNETKPAATPATQPASTPAPSPSAEPSTPAATAAAWKAGDKVKVTINGAAVEATVVSVDEKAGKATVKVHGETKERTVNVSEIVKQ